MKQSVEHKVLAVIDYCAAFLERINNTARHLLGGDPDLAPERNVTNLGDMAV